MNTTCCSLGSGSSGNAYFVRHGRTRLLIDAGMTLKVLKERMAQIDECLDDVAGVLVTHEHLDHAKGIGPLARRYGVPVFMTRGTAMRLGPRLAGADVCMVEAGLEFDLPGMDIRVFELSHDAAQPVGYSVRTDDGKIVVATDIGEITKDVFEELNDSALAFLEANHDIDCLMNGSYPRFLKNRIKSRMGHLSNAQAADVLSRLDRKTLRVIMLSHLSALNNSPSIAFNAIKGSIAGNDDIKIGIAHRDRPGKIIGLDGGCVIW